jgi:hypothetical protein
LRAGDDVLFDRFERFHRLPGSVPESGVIVAPHPSNDGIVRRYDVQDKSGRTWDIPTKRIYIAEQGLVDRRQNATGIPPEQTVEVHSRTK